MIIVPALLCAAAFAWLLTSILAVLDGPHTNRRLWSLLTAAGAALLLSASVVTAISGAGSWRLPLPFYLGQIGFTLHLDLLAAWFLAILGAAAIPAAVYAHGYLEHYSKQADLRIFWGATPLLLGSMAGVVLAGNAIEFLVFWELMSLSSFLLVGVEHRKAGVRQAALIYLGATRAGTAFLAGGFLWAHALCGSWSFADWHIHGVAALGPGLLILTGLGVKAGVWPFHLWLPIAHPAAPAPVSGLMSGVMVKIAVYAIIRLFVLPSSFSHPAFGYVLLATGAVSAFWGVLFALLQHDLKRLLAYHTVENVGLILLGIGIALVAQRLGMPFVARIALAAALFHALNHALFKSLLFLGAGAVETGAGTRDIERLGGLARRMPATFACFVLGSAAICALPPLNGFASEWLLYQGALRAASDSATAPIRFVMLLVIGWIALTGALALACFVKACGVTFLGRARSPSAANAVEVTLGMRTAQASLAGACVLAGLFAPVVLHILSPIVASLQPAGPPLARAWTLPYPALLLVLALTLAAGALWMSAATRRRPTRRFITWECGFGDLTPRMQVTATSFAQPIVRLFGAVVRYAIHLHVDGADPRLFPEEITADPHTEAVLESRVYSPIVRLFGRAGDWVVRLQAGSIHLYLLTMFLTLLVLLVIGGHIR